MINKSISFISKFAASQNHPGKSVNGVVMDKIESPSGTKYLVKVQLNPHPNDVPRVIVIDPQDIICIE